MSVVPEREVLALSVTAGHHLCTYRQVLLGLPTLGSP